MTMPHLISKWSILGLIAAVLVAFGAVMLTTNIRAHGGNGPTGGGWHPRVRGRKYNASKHYVPHR